MFNILPVSYLIKALGLKDVQVFLAPGAVL